jgi:hypothetical protein
MPKFLTWIEGEALPTPGSMPVATGPITYDSFDAVPRPLRAHIARLALLRGFTSDQLSEVWCMPVEWVQRVVQEASFEDVGDHIEAMPRE